MIYRIGTEKLKIPQKTKQKAEGTVVAWRDVAETCRCLFSVMNYIEKEPKTIVDGVAGSGFWGAVFRNNWKNAHIHFNESDEKCVPILVTNYPNDVVTSHDISSWVPPNCDLGILEFHHFTLKMWDKWEPVLKLWDENTNKLIIADGACFGFKFGNLKRYDCDDEKEYYDKLDQTARQVLSKRITAISKFTNAAIILLENKDGDGWSFLPPASVPLYKGGIQHKIKTQKTVMKEGLWTGQK